MDSTPSVRPVPGDPATTLAELRAVLSGDTIDPIAPLPGDPAGRARTLAAVGPDRPLEGPCAVVLTTSGSSGRPKGVRLSASAMRASATATHDFLGGPGQWLLVLPVTSVAGLQVLVRSLLAGTEPVVDAGDFSAPPRHRYAAIVPTQLQRWVTRAPEQLRACAAVLVGGGPTAPDLLAAAAQVAPQTRVIRTYGMTETCGGCVYDGAPLPGVEVAIDPVTDRIRLRGPMLADGYRGADCDSDHGAGPSAAFVDGWFATTDRGRLDDGRLRVIGRLDDVVISGGVKVAIDAVTARVRALPGLAEAVCLGVPDTEWGTVVTVFVAECNHLGLTQIRDAVAAGLPRTWAPRRLVEVEEWPMLANGKLDRQRLIEQAAR